MGFKNLLFSSWRIIWLSYNCFWPSIIAIFYSLSPLDSLVKMTDLVAVWDVALSDGVHRIEFEHGTTSGKRVVYVDGKVGKRRVTL